MPGFLLHQGATVACLHGGQAQPTEPNVRLLVSGLPTVFPVPPYVVAGCTLPPPPAANGPCVTAAWTTPALRVFSMGRPLLLNTSQATCAPSGTPLVPVSCQTRVVGS
jgi:hypothetical protein